MRRGSGRRGVAAAAAVVAGLALTGGAIAHPFPGWSGTAGPFSWEAKRLTCGVAGEEPSTVRAHSRWRSSPVNGFQRVTFTRQIRNEATDTWVTVQRQRRSTRNTSLEGTSNVLHWRQLFFTTPAEAGKRTRHIVFFEWLRDRPGADKRVAARTMTFKPCVVAAN